MAVLGTQTLATLIAVHGLLMAIAFFTTTVRNSRLLERQPRLVAAEIEHLRSTIRSTSAPILSLQSGAGAAVRLVTRQAPTPDYS